MPRRPGQAHQQLGATLGPRLAKIVSQAVHDHMRRTMHTRAKIGTEAMLGFFRTLEAERNTHTQPFLAKLLGHDGTPPELERILQFIHSGKGELSALLGGELVYNAIGTSLASGIANIVAPANQAIMYADPAQVLPPDAMASLAATGVVTQDYAEHIAQMSGLPAMATKMLVEQARSYPDIGSLLELYRRNRITEEDVKLALTRAGIPPNWHEAMMDLQYIPLLPADLALMVLKGIMTREDAEHEARLTGVTKERLGHLIEATGEPIGPMQLLEAYRRGFIDEKRLEHGVRQSRIRDEWMDVILKLRYEPPATSDAIRGVVQGHLSLDQAKTYAQQNGLEPGNLEWMVETAGNPPSPTQAWQLYNRGVIDRAQAEQAMREGRLKDKYIKGMMHLHEKLPEQRQVVTMITRGALSEKDGAAILHKIGYSETVVKALVESATSSQVVRDKNLAASEIIELYYDHAIDEDQAVSMLHTLGYVPHNAKLMLRVADLRREKTLRQAAMSPIRTAYIDKLIDKTTASVALDKLGIPHKQRDYALKMWTFDREQHRKTLTEAQIVRANEHGLLTDTEAERRLETLGYDHTDARILLDLQKDRTTPAP